MMNIVPFSRINSMLPLICSTSLTSSESPTDSVFLKSIWAGNPMPLSETVRIKSGERGASLFSVLASPVKTGWGAGRSFRVIVILLFLSP